MDICSFQVMRCEVSALTYVKARLRRKKVPLVYDDAISGALKNTQHNFAP
jgi:hypothetical protein